LRENLEDELRLGRNALSGRVIMGGSTVEQVVDACLAEVNRGGVGGEAVRGELAADSRIAPLSLPPPRRLEKLVAGFGCATFLVGVATWIAAGMISYWWLLIPGGLLGVTIVLIMAQGRGRNEYWKSVSAQLRRRPVGSAAIWGEPERAEAAWRIGMIVATHAGWPVARFVPEDPLPAVWDGPYADDMMGFEILDQLEAVFGLGKPTRERDKRLFMAETFGQLVDAIRRAADEAGKTGAVTSPSQEPR
jgi:hypothetical protein